MLYCVLMMEPLIKEGFLKVKTNQSLSVIFNVQKGLAWWELCFTAEEIISNIGFNITLQEFQVWFKLDQYDSVLIRNLYSSTDVKL